MRAKAHRPPTAPVVLEQVGVEHGPQPSVRRSRSWVEGQVDEAPEDRKGPRGPQVAPTSPTRVVGVQTVFVPAGLGLHPTLFTTEHQQICDPTEVVRGEDRGDRPDGP